MLIPDAVGPEAGSNRSELMSVDWSPLNYDAGLRRTTQVNARCKVWYMTSTSKSIYIYSFFYIYFVFWMYVDIWMFIVYKPTWSQLFYLVVPKLWVKYGELPSGSETGTMVRVPWWTPTYSWFRWTSIPSRNLCSVICNFDTSIHTWHLPY